jgi:hypothetical protein
MTEAHVPVPAPAAPAEAAISPVAAIAGTFSSPSDTFRRLMVKPTWWLPLVLSVATFGVSYFIASPKIDIDKTVRESIEKRAEKTGRTIPPEVVDRQIAMMKRMQPVFFGVGFAIVAALFFILALIFWGAAKAMGGDARYAQMLALWGHASLPGIIAAIVSIPLFLSVPDASLTQKSAQMLVKSNVGAFLPEDTPGFLLALAGSIDIFSFATLALLVVGLRRVPGLSKGSATAIPLALWAVYVLGKTGWAAVFG